MHIAQTRETRREKSPTPEAEVATHEKKTKAIGGVFKTLDCFHTLLLASSLQKEARHH